MKICLFLTVGRDIFGLGFNLERLKTDWMFELQLGPVNVSAGYGWPARVTFFGCQIYRRS